jgi:hypothetical protein
MLFMLNEDGHTKEDGVPKSLVHTAIISEIANTKFPGIEDVVMNTVIRF